jgi:hypothetical protein
MEDLPQSETELIAVAKRLIALITDNPKFANAPVSMDELCRQLDAKSDGGSSTPPILWH